MTHAAPAANPNLPADVAALRALVLATMAERDVLAEERDALASQNDRLRHLLIKLQRLQFGRKSERLPEEQLQLGLEDLETAIAAGEAKAEQRDPDLRRARTTKRRANRGALPAHLPRIGVVLEPQDTACQACAGVVVQTPAPPRLIAGGLPTEALVAHVLVSRYADHLPLYRQAQILARQGVALDRATLAFWVGYAAAESPRWCAGCGRSCWPRRGCSPTRPWCRCSTPVVAEPSTATSGRSRATTGPGAAPIRRRWPIAMPPAGGTEHTRALLGGYRGILQCGGYAAYKSLADPVGVRGPRVLAFCWSHVRRGFYDLARTAAAPIATEALARIAALYRIEADIRGQAAEARRDARQARSRPLVTELHAWFTAQTAKLPARSPTAEAIRYALNHWDGLCQFLDDGRIEIDNNSVERAMRPIALSRKNALFAGSDEGGENWAAVASLIETCKLNAVDPQRYLTGLLTRLVNGWPQARIDALMPWNCTADTDA